jgi:hypothetical protein
MALNGVTASFTRDEIRAQAPGGHPPVIVSGKLTANAGIYPAGLLLKRDADGVTLIPAAEGDTFAGVLDRTVDTSLETSGNVVIHGSVQYPVLKVGAVTPVAPTTASLLALQRLGIYPQ